MIRIIKQIINFLNQSSFTPLLAVISWLSLYSWLVGLNDEMLLNYFNFNLGCFFVYIVLYTSVNKSHLGLWFFKNSNRKIFDPDMKAKWLEVLRNKTIYDPLTKKDISFSRFLLKLSALFKTEVLKAKPGLIVIHYYMDPDDNNKILGEDVNPMAIPSLLLALHSRLVKSDEFTSMKGKFHIKTYMQKSRGRYVTLHKPIGVTANSKTILNDIVKVISFNLMRLQLYKNKTKSASFVIVLYNDYTVGETKKMNTLFKNIVRRLRN